jgi:hypothetical protein
MLNLNFIIMNSFKKVSSLMILGLMFAGMQSCKKEEMPPAEDPEPDPMMSETYDYEFNNGQVVSSAAYNGMHRDDFSASLMVEELSEESVKITVKLMNTLDGEMYMIHAHDAADPNTTPNGTPYNETPNAEVFVQMVDGNGGTIEVSQTVDMTYTQITEQYEGFFVVHDPLQGISTTDISTYLVVGSFARQQATTDYNRLMYSYDFNNGQLNAAFAYDGMHADNLSGMLMIQELADGGSRVSVQLENTNNGETYMVHAHDAADASTTPNGTPYDETPNSDICTLMIEGNGGSARNAQFSTMSVDQLSSMYDGFFVVHDPLQPIDTTDPTTYVLLGLFARN